MISHAEFGIQLLENVCKPVLMMVILFCPNLVEWKIYLPATSGKILKLLDYSKVKCLFAYAGHKIDENHVFANFFSHSWTENSLCFWE